MTARSVKEWIATSPDAKIPPRVKRRILDRDDWKCHVTKVDLRLLPANQIQFDHLTALINGGEHREKNLAPIWAKIHVEKTKADVAEKSAIAKKVKSHFGLNNPKPGFQRDPQVKAAVGGGVKPRAKAESRHPPLPPRPPLYVDI